MVTSETGEAGSMTVLAVSNHSCKGTKPFDCVQISRTGKSLDGFSFINECKCSTAVSEYLGSSGFVT